MTTRMFTKGLGRHSAVALVALAVATASIWAQAPAPTANWQGWYGCWVAVTAEPLAAPSPKVCVTPAPSLGEAAVTFSTITDGLVIDRTTLRVTGERQQADREGCTGWESASWAESGSRIYVRSQHVCEGGLERNATAIIALSGSTWMEVRRIASTGVPGFIRAVRYEPVPSTQIPAEILAELPVDREMSISTARIASASAVTIDDVIDASRHVDAPVVQAWLVERGQQFDLDSKQLLRLSSARVADGIVDVMVALTYPTIFAFDRQAPDAEARWAAAPGAPVAPVMVQDYYGSRQSGFDSFDWMSYNRAMYRYGSSMYGGYYGGARPVYVYVRGSDLDPEAAAARARVVKNAGYTQGGTTSTTSSSGARAPSLSGGSTSSGSSSSGSSGSAASGGSSSGGEVRTAKPRPPGGE